MHEGSSILLTVECQVSVESLCNRFILQRLQDLCLLLNCLCTNSSSCTFACFICQLTVETNLYAWKVLYP
jgi:hypothetical protein